MLESLRKFKTIDAWLDHAIPAYTFGTTTNVEKCCRHLLIFNFENILDFLKLETNEPSKYDLFLVKNISELYNSSDPVIQEVYTEILHIYRSRL